MYSALSKTKGDITKDVLVYQEAGSPLGLCTIGIMEDMGFIGLFAVDENATSRSIGKKLMARTLMRFNEWGVNAVEVVIQKANIVASHFYQASGFVVSKQENIYHLWT